MSNSFHAENPLVEEAKRKAKHLHSLLTPRVNEIKLGECLNFYAKMQGARDWNVLSAMLNQTKPEQDPKKIDEFIKNTALPWLISLAAKHDMKVDANASDIGDGDTFGRLKPVRSIPISIVPLGQQNGESFCEPFLEVSTTSIRLSCNGFDIRVNFMFPIKAFSLASQLVSSDKTNGGDEEPQVTRCQQQGQTFYMFSINTHGVSDSADRGLDIFTDKEMHHYFQKGLDRFFGRYARICKAFSALSGRWGNKRLIEGFENALWKMNNDEPLYMAASNKFYTKIIAGVPLYAALGKTGPYIAGSDSSVEIGVCSIIELENGSEKQPAGYYIAKYGDDSQVRIYLKDFTVEDLDKVTAEFGIPRGRYSEDETSFYKTPAFNGLRTWMRNNPKYAKRVGRDGGRYLPDWFERAMQKLL